MVVLCSARSSRKVVPPCGGLLYSRHGEDVFLITSSKHDQRAPPLKALRNAHTIQRSGCLSAEACAARVAYRLRTNVQHALQYRCGQLCQHIGHDCPLLHIYCKDGGVSFGDTPPSFSSSINEWAVVPDMLCLQSSLSNPFWVQDHVPFLSHILTYVSLGLL